MNSTVYSIDQSHTLGAPMLSRYPVRVCLLLQTAVHRFPPNSSLRHAAVNIMAQQKAIMIFHHHVVHFLASVPLDGFKAIPK